MKTDFKFHRIAKPKFRPKVTEILKIEPKEIHPLLALGTEIHWFGIHWDNDRTRACRENRDECHLCIDKVPWKQQGYLHVHHQKLRAHFFLEVTEYAAERFQLLQGKRPTPRGMLFSAARSTNNKRSPLYFTSLGEAREDLYASVKERTPEDTLMVLWNLN